MCQCVVCDCWWCNFCGVCCGGVSQLFCCIGYWCCQDDQMVSNGAKCCYVCQKSGYGGNCFCNGGVCCAPDWLLKYSQAKK